MVSQIGMLAVQVIQNHAQNNVAKLSIVKLEAIKMSKFCVHMKMAFPHGQSQLFE